MSSWLEQAEAMRGKAITPQRHNTYDSNIAELKKNVNEFLSEEAKETEHKDADDPEYDPSGRKYPPALQGKRKESSHDPSGYPYPKEKKTKDYTWPNEKATEAPGGEQGRPPSREGFDKEEKKKIEAYGVKGMNSTSWRKTFPNEEALNKWAKENSAEVQGTREGLDELSPEAKKKQEENHKLAEKEKEQSEARTKYLNSVKPHNSGNRN